MSLLRCPDTSVADSVVRPEALNTRPKPAASKRTSAQAADAAAIVAPLEQPTISVAMATYNGGKYLRAQLQSLARQSRRPKELVIVDDGSTDQTLKIAKAFARTMPFPVRIYRNGNRLGYRRNFMRAAQICRGDLVAFCDQDDVWAPQKLAEVAAAFKDDSVLMVYHNARLINDSGKNLGLIFKNKRSRVDFSPLGIEPWRIVPGFSQTVRRYLVRYSKLHAHSVDMFDSSEHMPHDQWFIFLASALGKVVYLPSALAHYRQHEQNTSGWLKARPIAHTIHNIANASYYATVSSEAVSNRLDLLRRLQRNKRKLNLDHQTVDAAIKHYTRIKGYVERRSRLYTERSFYLRARMLYSLVKSRSYSDPKVKFDRGSFWLDTIVGVPVGPVLRRA